MIRPNSHKGAATPCTFFPRIANCVLLAVASFAATASWADTVKTEGGATLTGTITRATEGAIELDTGYSGNVKVDQAMVVSLESENPLHVRLDSGTVLIGTIAPGAQSPMISINTGNGIFNTAIANISEIWPQGQEDPAVTALKTQAESEKRSWSYTAGLNLSGQSGNSDEFGLAANFGAFLKGPSDQLKFYFSVLNSERDGDTSANETKGGVDYSSDLVSRYGWYTRFELEKDELEDLDLRSTSAIGISYKVLERPDRKIGARAGFAYRHESYTNFASEEYPSLDLGLDYQMIYKDLFKLDTVITFVPDFGNFSDIYRLTQDTGVNLPLLNKGIWSLRLGFSNEYNSAPVPGKEELDTRYYTRLQFDWGD